MAEPRQLTADSSKMATTCPGVTARAGFPKATCTDSLPRFHSWHGTAVCLCRSCAYARWPSFGALSAPVPLKKGLCEAKKETRAWSSRKRTSYPKRGVSVQFIRVERGMITSRADEDGVGVNVF